MSQHIPPQSLEEQWDVKGLEEKLASDMNESLPLQQWLDDDDRLDEEALHERILQAIIDSYHDKEELAGAEVLRNFEKHILLRILDDKWKEHLATMDHLRQGIHLRGYAQKNPKQEYKREAFDLFQQMLEDIKYDTIRIISNVQVQEDDRTAEIERQRREEMARRMQFKHVQAVATEGEEEVQNHAEQHQPFVREGRKIGRNDSCPCGSGKKYKQCHGKIS
ncbi:MAG: SEC-C metal-binding domain-containing protein [Endozoicomonas sp.]